MTGFDYSPRLTGELVVLRPLVADDWDALYTVARDPLIWAGHPAHDRWQEPVFRRYFDDALAAGGLLVTDRANGDVIGSTRYSSARAGPDEIEIGWTFLVRSHWGGRFNGEMKALMLRHAFRFVARVIFFVGKDNQRSRAALERIGARLTDRQYSDEIAGRAVPRAVYAIDRPEPVRDGV